MWVDESGGTDPNASSTDGLIVHVDGHEYAAELNYDLNHDGVNDTAIVENADGTAQAFESTHHNGVADHLVQLDAAGHVTDEAVYDEASGKWVEIGGHDGTGHGHDQQANAGGTIHADLPQGETDVGPATIDTNGDGVNDTAVVRTADGGTMAFTDKDGDGEADVMVKIDASGHSTTYDHTGKGEWTEEASGLVGDSSGQYATSDAAWGAPGTSNLDGVAKIDSVTGQWISPN